MKIAIQGTAGSFHHQVAATMVPDKETAYVYANNFKQVFKEVADGKVDYGVVAVENNLFGSINEVYRLLSRYGVWISREVRMKINQCLIGSQSISVSDLNSRGSEVRVLSQAPALAQVELWLDKHVPLAVREETHDTAESVKTVVNKANPNIVAVAGAQAAELYGANIIAKNINDEPDNYTRFVLFSMQEQPNNKATASTIQLTTGHAPGALGAALQSMAKHGLNLTNIYSHPVPGDQQHYSFYIDIDKPYKSPQVVQAFKELESNGCQIVLLGSYDRLSTV